MLYPYIFAGKIRLGLPDLYLSPSRVAGVSVIGRTYGGVCTIET